MNVRAVYILCAFSLSHLDCLKSHIYRCFNQIKSVGFFLIRIIFVFFHTHLASILKSLVALCTLIHWAFVRSLLSLHAFAKNSVQPFF